MGLFAEAPPPGVADPERVRRCCDGIAALMRARLGARGACLDETVRHSGHRLPEALRDEAAYLVECAALAGHPRLIQRVDPARMAHAEAACRAHLDRVGRWSRRGALALSALRHLALIALATTALALGLALWRGVI